MATKRNYNEFTPSQNVAIYAARRRGNTFIPAVNYDIGFIVVKGSRRGNSGNVYLNIYDADGSHFPAGASLATVTKAQGDLPTDNYTEITFTLDSALSVIALQEYAYTIHCDGADSSNAFLHARQVVSQSDYYISSQNGGSSWSASQTSSLWYQVWEGAVGNDPVDTPSPADSATGQQSGSVDLSWADPNDPDFDDYEVYFGPTGSMVLVETGYATMSLTISDDMILGQEYSWRIDGNDGVDVVTGSVWTFTVEGFLPPSTNLTDKKRLVVASFNEIWYEDIA